MLLIYFILNQNNTVSADERPQRPPKRPHDETSLPDEGMEPPGKKRLVKDEDIEASDQSALLVCDYKQRIAILEAENRELQHSLAEISRKAEEDGSRRPRNWVRSARDWAASFWG